MRYCLMYDEVFYNVFPEAITGCPIEEVVIGGTLTTYYDEDEAEGAKFSAYARLTEYVDNQLKVPELVHLIPDLEVVPIDEEIEAIIDDLCLDMVKAYE